MSGSEARDVITIASALNPRRMRCHRIPTRDPMQLCRDAVRPYLWKALASGSMHPPPATRSCHPPPDMCLSLLHLCTGRRPICTFAPRAARGAAPARIQLCRDAVPTLPMLGIGGLRVKSDLPGYPFGSSPRALIAGKGPFHPPFKGCF